MLCLHMISANPGWYVHQYMHAAPKYLCHPRFFLFHACGCHIYLGFICMLPKMCCLPWFLLICKQSSMVLDQLYAYYYAVCLCLLLPWPPTWLWISCMHAAMLFVSIYYCHDVFTSVHQCHGHSYIYLAQYTHWQTNLACFGWKDS